MGPTVTYRWRHDPKSVHVCGQSSAARYQSIETWPYGPTHGALQRVQIGCGEVFPPGTAFIPWPLPAVQDKDVSHCMVRHKSVIIRLGSVRYASFRQTDPNCIENPVFGSHGKACHGFGSCHPLGYLSDPMKADPDFLLRCVEHYSKRSNMHVDALEGY